MHSVSNIHLKYPMMYLSLPRTLVCIAVLGIFHENSVQGQTCPGGAAQLVQTSSVTKVGDANDTYALAMFDPSIGTLYSVDLNSVIYFTYAYRLTNMGATPEYYDVNVTRDDSLYAYSPDYPTPLEAAGETFFRQVRYRPGSVPLPPVPVVSEDPYFSHN
jgi:hypothetical protein